MFYMVIAFICIKNNKEGRMEGVKGVKGLTLKKIILKGKNIFFIFLFFISKTIFKDLKPFTPITPFI